WAQAGIGTKKPAPPTSRPTPAGRPAAAQPVDPDGPRVEVSPPEFDFGEVWEGAPIKREFTVKNTGKQPLTVSVLASCGCTVVSKPKSPLAPGESGTFSISYRTSRLGHTRKRVTVATNDPTRPRAVIQVRGCIKPVFELNPARKVTFRGLELDSTETQTMKLRNNYDKPVHLKLKEGQDFGPFEVEFKEISKGLEYDLNVTTKPPLKLGINNATVVLETDLKDLPTLMVRLYARAQPRVFVTPSPLYVSPRMNKPTPRALVIQYRKDTPIKITGVKSSLATLTWELQPPRELPAGASLLSHRLNVTLPAFEDIPVEGALLEIFTDEESGEFAKLEVPIKRHIPASRLHRRVPPPEKKPGQEQPAKPSGVKGAG
ncbi:MAG: DUF1573 domain-containing protein, partial [Phycisphaerae bacterium]|nr:DUF1573 domain-containing protein [Phycisphaerae bacterium]